jgi:hypothetical protein
MQMCSSSWPRPEEIGKTELKKGGVCGQGSSHLANCPVTFGIHVPGKLGT